MLDYEVKIYPVIEDGKIEYYAECLALKGCAGQGCTAEEALSEVQENMKLWLETAEEVGIPIPIPKNYAEDNDCSGKFMVRTSKWLHKKIKELSENQGISQNALVCEILSEGIGLRGGAVSKRNTISMDYIKANRLLQERQSMVYNGKDWLGTELKEK